VEYARQRLHHAHCPNAPAEQVLVAPMPPVPVPQQAVVAVAL